MWPGGAGIVLSALYFRIDVFLVQLWSGTESVARQCTMTVKGSGAVAEDVVMG